VHPTLTRYLPPGSPLRVDSRLHPLCSEWILRGYPRLRRHRSVRPRRIDHGRSHRQQHGERAGDQRSTHGQRTVNTWL